MPEVDEVIFDLRRPIRQERIFGAEADEHADARVLHLRAEAVVRNTERRPIGRLRPRHAALAIEHQAIKGETDAARDIRKPIVLGRAGENGYAGRRALDVGPGEVTLDAQHEPRVHLVIVATLDAAQEAIGLGLRQRDAEPTTTAARPRVQRLHLLVVEVDAVERGFGRAPAATEVPADIE